MDKKYQNTGSVFVRTTEECSELIHIICKAERFGLENYHPNDLTRTSNKILILKEIDDVRLVLAELERDLRTQK